MRIKLLVGRAGDRFSNAPGDVIEVSATEGQRLIDTHQAMLAEVAAPETAAKPKPRRRTKKAD
jgi:hypothetical protein